MDEEVKSYESLIEEAHKTLDRNISWINSADSKASILLGVYAFLFGGSIFLVDPEIIKQLSDSGTLYGTLAGGIMAVTGIAFLFTILLIPFFLVKAIIVKISKNTKENKKAGRITFFSDIANQSMYHFKSKFTSISEEDYLDDLLNQVHTTSYSAHKKYENLNCAYVSFIIFISSAIIYSLLQFLVQNNYLS